MASPAESPSSSIRTTPCSGGITSATSWTTGRATRSCATTGGSATRLLDGSRRERRPPGFSRIYFVHERGSWEIRPTEVGPADPPPHRRHGRPSLRPGPVPTGTTLEQRTGRRHRPEDDFNGGVGSARE